MTNEIETSINTEAEIRVSADQYDEGVWLCLQGRRSMMSVPLRDCYAMTTLGGDGCFKFKFHNLSVPIFVE
jgi:hypothetical protein